MRYIQILAKNILYKGWSTLTGYDIQYTFPDGKRYLLKREIYDSGDGAAALLVNPEKKSVIFVRQYRLAAHLNGHKDGFLLECCAGMLEKHRPEDAIKKEITEETGIHPSQIIKVGETWATPGAHMEKIHLYIGLFEDKDRTGTGGGLAEEQEDIEVLEHSFEEVIKMVDQGEIEDAKTLILIQHGMLKGYIS